jgi:hypothetical protein
MNQMKDFDRKWYGSDFGITLEQYEGTSVQARSSRQFHDFDTAEIVYLKSRKRLLNVNQWQRYMDDTEISFRLTDTEGNESESQAEKDLLIRADIQDSNHLSSERRCDWVIIEDLEEGSTDEMEYVVFRVKPCENPKENEGQPTHFFFAAITGSLVLHRESLSVTCTVYARNLEAYTDHLSEGSGLDGSVSSVDTAHTDGNGLPGMNWQRLVDSLWE